MSKEVLGFPRALQEGHQLAAFLAKSLLLAPKVLVSLETKFISSKASSTLCSAVVFEDQKN